MPLKIVRNDITKMQTDAIVNTANEEPIYSTGCDLAIYMAAGEKELLKYRQEHIGYKNEGDVFITPGFNLYAKYIIHAVSPYYIDGNQGEEELLRKCYRDSLLLAAQNNIRSIAFPLISTGGFQYPKEEGMRVAVDEINSFLLSQQMDIYLVVFDTKATLLGEKIYPELESYIDHNYVCDKREEEYGDRYFGSVHKGEDGFEDYARIRQDIEERRPVHNKDRNDLMVGTNAQAAPSLKSGSLYDRISRLNPLKRNSNRNDDYDAVDACVTAAPAPLATYSANLEMGFDESALNERMKHLSDTFSQYLMYLIESKGMDNVEVYKRAIVDKKMFSKLKNNPDYHPQKITALCLCVGAKLNLDETKDLLARAGYALSPCDKTDIIFKFFIEKEIYDMIEIDIQLEEHGLPCIIQ